MTSWTSVRAIRKKLPIDICHEIPNQCFLGGRIRLGISPARLTSANKILALYLESPHIHKLVQSVLLQYNPKCSNTMPLTVIVFFFFYKYDWGFCFTGNSTPDGPKEWIGFKAAKSAYLQMQLTDKNSSCFLQQLKQCFTYAQKIKTENRK